MDRTSMRSENMFILHIITEALNEPVNFGWNPILKLIKNKAGNFSDKELSEIEKLIEEHKETLLDQLDLFYSGQPVKAIRK
jgi:hypothetical protein